jgi:hypothetical protein
MREYLKRIEALERKNPQLPDTELCFSVISTDPEPPAQIKMNCLVWKDGIKSEVVKYRPATPEDIAGWQRHQEIAHLFPSNRAETEWDWDKI